VYIWTFKSSQKSQESAGCLGKAANSCLSGREVVVLIAKSVPTVRRTVNVFQRHLSESLELEEGDYSKEIARRYADALPTGTARFEVSQERLAFPSQRCGSVPFDCSGKLEILVEHEGISAET
jgi:hypothetical protein